VAPLPAEHRLAMRFVGWGSEHCRSWIVNLLLTIVTPGLYHQVAKVRRLRDAERINFCREAGRR
jgi:uncharacterized membrane protein YjgN (DUF898 family)